MNVQSYQFDMEAVLKPIKPSGGLDRKLTEAEIRERIRRIERVLPELRRRQEPCGLCPRRCGVARVAGDLGECGLALDFRVAAVARHCGEEPPISGDVGAINIFFSGCNLHCIHCQNWPISQNHVGLQISPEDLAEKILKKWCNGAQSLGWVTPTPQIVPALEAYLLCLQEGFNLPLVHNNGGYEDPEVIRLLSGIVDVWLPDAKTADPGRGRSIQGVPDYPSRSLEAIKAMVEQLDEGATRAVIVRHLALPGGLEDSKLLLKTLREQFRDQIHISLMGQYFPTYKTIGHQVLGRRITRYEYHKIVSFARNLGFEKGWVQHYETDTGISPYCLS